MNTGLIVLAGRVLTSLSAMAIVVVVARYSTKEITASYQLAFSAALLLSLVVQGGMPNVTLRAVAIAVRDKDAVGAAKVGLSAILWSIFLAVTCFIFSFPFQHVSSISIVFQPLAANAQIISLWASAMALQVVASELFRAHHKQLEATLFGGVLSQMTSLIAMVLYVLVFDHVEFSVLVTLSLAPIFFSLSIAMLLLLKGGCVGRGGSGLVALIKGSTRLYLSGVRLVGIGLLSYFVLQSNLWVASVLTADPAELASFSVAIRLVSSLALISVVISGAYMPTVAKFVVSKDKDQLDILVARVAALTSAVALLAFVLILFSSDYLVGVLFGASYNSAAKYLKILAVGFALTSLTGLRSQILIVAGFEKTQLMILAASATFYVLLVFLAGYFYGLFALAWMGVFVLGGIGLVEALVLYRKTGIRSWPRIMANMSGASK